MAPELENDRRENVTKLFQAHDVSARTVYENSEALKEVGQVGGKTAFLGNEEGAIQDM